MAVGHSLVSLFLKMKPDSSVKTKSAGKLNLDFDLNIGINKRDLKALALPFASLVICLFFLVFLVIPKWKIISKMAKESKTVKEKRDEFVSKVQILSTIEEGELKNYYALASLAVPENKDVSLALFAFSEPARKNGFFLNELSFNLGQIEAINEDDSKQQETSSLDPEKIAANMSLVGSADRTDVLLADLEKGLPLMQVDKFEYTQVREGMANIDLSISFFYSSEKAAYRLEDLKIAELSLSDSEQDLLKNLAGFDKQEKVLEALRLSKPATGGAVGRDNPFYLE